MNEAKNLDLSKSKALLSRLIAILERDFAEEILSVALFGSVARGRASSESDIDLLILHRKGTRRIVENFSKALLELRNTNEYLALQDEGFIPDTFPLFLDEVKLKEHPWVLLDIIEDGIILLDKGNILKNELKHLRQTLKLLGSKKITLEDGTWYWDLKPDWQPGEVIKL